jgi:UDP-N-acetylenolpyruvoylglucosamine reductase
MRPSHYVGAEIPVLGVNAHWDQAGDLFVAEGDESDGTLVHYHPLHTVFLNAEAEHLDFFKDLDAIKDVFRRLLEQTRGTVFYCAVDKAATELATARGNCVSYGWASECDYSARDLEVQGRGTRFKVFHKGELLGEAHLNIPGRHNVLNALGVTSLATELGVPFPSIVESLATFRGARRRFELKYQSERFTVVDDYGHHPTEIRATIDTALSQNPQRLVCVFQPHRYTRTKLLCEDFGYAFDKAGAVFVTDVYPASEKPIPGVTGELVVDEIRKRSPGDVFYTPDVTLAHAEVGNYLREGDMLLSLGAGNVHEVARRLVRDLSVIDRMREAMDDPGALFRLYEPMRRHTTIKVGGPAQYWIEPRTVEGFARLVRHCVEQDIPVRVVGRGSNLLIRDGGIAGAVIHPSKGEFEAISVQGDEITAGVGVRFKKVTAAARQAGLGGFEWMEGIPGNVGGSLRMNAGAMGVCTFDQVVSVRLVNLRGEILEKPAEEFNADYRNVPDLMENYAVSAVFRGQPGSMESIDRKIEESREKRKSSQPVAASSGCIFKNPEDCPAGKLVEELGLKDRVAGGARVSEVHGNFIVNDGGATAADVLELISQIQQVAHDQRDIELKTEVQIAGQDEPIR